MQLPIRPVEILKRLCIVMISFFGSGIALLVGQFALNDIASAGKVGSVVAWTWLLAVLALCVLSVTWIVDARLGKIAVGIACTLGVAGLLSYPVYGAVRAGIHWSSEFSGALGMELLVTFPSLVLAVRLSHFHASRRISA